MMSQINYAVIVAGGLGTRMKKVNPELPKELLPVKHKPVIQYAFEEIHHTDISNVIVIINKDKDIVREYIEGKRISKELYPSAAESLNKILKKVKISFLYQNQPKGEMDALSLAEESLGENHFAMIYPDGLFFPTGNTLKRLCDVFQKYQANTIALAEVNQKNASVISNSGRVNLKRLDKGLYKIREFLPKADGYFERRFPKELRTSGLMISRCEIFNYINSLRDNIENELIDFDVRRLMTKDFDFYGCYARTEFFDVGNPKGYQFCLQNIPPAG